jgi:hypothetical protein
LILRKNAKTGGPLLMRITGDQTIRHYYSGAAHFSTCGPGRSSLKRAAP